MLVLSRKVEESIHIGSDITIKICQVRGKVVRLGISAPDSLKVLRSELVGVEHCESVTEASSPGDRSSASSCTGGASQPGPLAEVAKRVLSAAG